MDMKNMTKEDIISMMDAEIDFAIDDQGWRGADSHWLTHKELSKRCKFFSLSCPKA